MQPTDLLPCPFCGKPPLIVCPDNSYGSAMVTCGDANECPVDLTAWGDLKTGETLDDAIKAWNTRALAMSRVETLGDVEREAAFLCARLREWEHVCDAEDCSREYSGHVSPSLARLEAALKDNPRG